VEEEFNMAARLAGYDMPPWWLSEEEHSRRLFDCSGFAHFQYCESVADTNSKSKHHGAPTELHIPSVETFRNARDGTVNVNRVQAMALLSGPKWGFDTMQTLLHRQYKNGGSLRSTCNSQITGEWSPNNPNYRVHRPVPYSTFRRYWEKVHMCCLLKRLTVPESIERLEFPRNSVIYLEYYEYIPDGDPIFG
jgi:hypothetical protein